MKINLTTIERLFSSIADYERRITSVAFTLSDLAQDVRSMREELEQILDKDRHYHAS